MGGVKSAIGSRRNHALQRVGELLESLENDAEQDWTPGRACGELVEYVDRIEGFTDSRQTARQVQIRLGWFSTIIQQSVMRSVSAGVLADAAFPVIEAIDKHDDVLRINPNVTTGAARAARDLIRLEVSYLTTQPASDSD